MQIRPNRAKQVLDAGGTIFTSSVRLSDPGLCELLGYAGFDFVLLDGEHGTADATTIDRLVQGCFAGNTVPIVRVLRNEEEGVPDVGRFNAGQKFVFWSMALLVPALFLTGIVIWEVYFGEATSIETQRAAALIHSYAAIAAIIIWITHVYAAIWVRGSMRGMTQGYVTPGWAWRHHRKWLRSLVSTGSRGPRPRRAAEGS